MAAELSISDTWPISDIMHMIMKDQYCQEIYLSGCRDPNHDDCGETEYFDELPQRKGLLDFFTKPLKTTGRNADIKIKGNGLRCSLIVRGGRESNT